MSIFERQEPRYRLAETQYGDTLRAVAFRELGDAKRWPELVYLNKLQPPFLTNVASEAGPSVILAGQKIKVPAIDGIGGAGVDAERVYGRDAVLTSKRLDVTVSGDIAVCSGVSNLHQQLVHRVVTPKGQLFHHPKYGSFVHRLMGSKNGPIASLLASDYVRAALESDYRVRSVKTSNADVSGDTLRVTAVAVAIDGTDLLVTIEG